MCHTVQLLVMHLSDMSEGRRPWITHFVGLDGQRNAAVRVRTCCHSTPYAQRGQSPSGNGLSQGQARVHRRTSSARLVESQVTGKEFLGRIDCLVAEDT